MTEPKNWVIDANIILRAVLDDVQPQTLIVKNLLQKAEEEKVRLLVPEPVISDVIFVLSRMKVPKAEIAETLRAWMLLPGIFPLGIDMDTLHTTLDLFVDLNISWPDSLIASKMFEWNQTEICTFDKHFDRIPGITRVDLSHLAD